jgi:methionyl-tRNA formyltransferase
MKALAAISRRRPRPARAVFTLPSRHIQHTSGRVLFFGSDDFALPSLEKLHDLVDDANSSVSHVGVVVPPDQRRSKNARPTPVPVKAFAHEHGLRVYEVPANVDGPMGLAKSGWRCPEDYDLGVVVSFGYFIPADTIDALACGAINVHPSLLPAYRGAAPIAWSVLRGDHKTGVSVIEVHPRAFDAGDMLLQVEDELLEDTTEPELRAHLAEVGSECLVAAVRNLDVGMRPQVKQSAVNGGGVVPAPKVAKKHGHVRWGAVQSGPGGEEKTTGNTGASLMCGDLDLHMPPSSRALYNRWRALGASVGVWADWVKNADCKKVEVRLVELERPVAEVPGIDANAAAPGDFFYSKPLKRLMIRCASDASDWSSDRDKLWVPCVSVQLPGKKVISCTDFVNGQRLGKKDWPQQFA